MAERSQCVSAAVFFAAARRGDADQVSLLLEQQPSLALQLDAFGKDALYYTQLLGHREVTELLQGEAAPLQQDRLPASLPGVVLSNEPQILRDEQEAMNAWDGAQDIAFQTTNGAWEHIIPTAPAMPSRQSPTLLNRGAPGSEVFHERTSPYSTSLREVFSMRGVRPSPSSLRRDSAAGPRTNGWVAQQLDFTDAQQRMGQTRPGTISRPLPAPFEASHLDRRLRDPHLPMGQARSGLVSDQDMSQPAAAAAAGAEAPQRITPGMRREQEERHRERMRRGGGNRRSYAFIDVDISSSDDEGYQADMMRTGSTHSSTAGAARVASQQDLPAWAGAASQPPSTTRSFWAARGGSSQPVPSPSAASPTPPKSPSGSKNVEVNAVAQSTDANLCKVCFSNAADTLFEPCRHLGLCRDCANEMETCPFCRKHIRRSAT
ncbi:hypothetical protein WJX84_004395 [Apatococcus fuscideae]|uniref:RING-type domain-containing protein n=1 Tax=Apatococcus fuscideae TaxID=2026836 RepID=A0AAW1SZD6_9CHLO